MYLNFLHLSDIFLAVIWALFLEAASLISCTMSIFLFFCIFLYLSLIFLAAIPADLVYFLGGSSSIISFPFIRASFLAFSLISSYFLVTFLAAQTLDFGFSIETGTLTSPWEVSTVSIFTVSPGNLNLFFLLLASLIFCIFRLFF